jgi:hypothetical protein
LNFILNECEYSGLGLSKILPSWRLLCLFINQELFMNQFICLFKSLSVFAVIITAGLSTIAFSAGHEFPSSDSSSAEIVEYAADFFDRYRPNTALDMVRQLPGFQLNDGTENRGFAASVGNILINNRRLSAKQDLPSATLARIPASLVDRIQLVRGQTSGIDLQGQSVVANVFLRSDVPAGIRWEAYIEQNNIAPIKPAASISISDNWKGINFNTGIDVERNTSAYSGEEQQFDGNGVLLSQGLESSKEDGYQINGISLNASGFIGETLAHLNSKYSNFDSLYQRPSSSIVQLSGITRDGFIETDSSTKQFELGIDAERSILPALTGKLIFLLTNRNQELYSSRINSNSVSGQTLFRIADTETIEKERIARLEFDWVGMTDHNIQANLEAAYNVLDQSLLQTDDTGSGPLVVDIPGANSIVKEMRWDFLLQDTWTLGVFKLDYGMGMEVSSVSQAGDADQKRNFLFLKPQSTLSYSPSSKAQTRLSMLREVSQLNLLDFVSATVFEDNDLALGNPDIRPEKTLVAEVSHERRLGEISVIRLTAFHRWISDVLDLLPITEDFEAPGNIGDGRRWGLEFENTVPLEWLGLPGSRLNTKLRWQNSTVVDPVTGHNRILSGEGGQNAYRTLTNRNKNNKYFVSVDYRQDFEVARVAWGWTLAERASRPLYRVNELDIYREDVAMDAFIETTRWFNLKIRLDAQNITDDAQERVRTIYTGERDLSPVNMVLINNRRNGRRLVLSVIGSF